MTAPAPSSGTTAEHARLAQATGRAEDDLFESRIPGDINGSSPTRRRTSLSYARVTTSSTGCSWSLTPGSGTCSASI
jgi:hypothetical protein